MNEVNLFKSNATNITGLDGNLSHAMIAIILDKKDLLPDPLSPTRLVVFMTVYIIIIVLALVGNVTVIVVIMRTKKTKTITFVLILSLAVSDLLGALLNMPYQLYTIVANEWHTQGATGEFLCKATNYIQGVSITATILTLTAITVDRYIVICVARLTKWLHNTKACIVILGFIWIISLCAMMPTLIYYNLDIRIKIDENMMITGFGYVCAELFPRAAEDSRIFSICVFVFLYALPVVMMIGLYGAIARRLWIRRPVGEASTAMHRNHTQKRRVIRMLICIVSVFTFLWLPFFSFRLYYDTGYGDPLYRIQMAVFLLIGYTNYCMNPIIYTFLNKNFQQELRKMFCRRNTRVESINIRTVTCAIESKKS